MASIDHEVSETHLSNMIQRVNEALLLLTDSAITIFGC